MSQVGETFFTRVGCMDGRVQIPLRIYGQKKFNAEYPDTITEAGIVGILANNPSPEFLALLKSKLDISIDKHHSQGILVNGHQECAGNPVDDSRHIDDIRASVLKIQELIGNRVSVVGVFVRRDPSNPSTWIVEEVPVTLNA